MNENIEEAKQALVVLVGVTADKIKREAVFRYFAENSLFDVYVPNLPQRLGLRWCARWLRCYLAQWVKTRNYRKVNFLNYISGGMVFRLAASRWSIGPLGRIVYFRGPIQERVPNALVDCYGKLALWLMQGKMVLDLAANRLERLPFPMSGEEQGLVIETGASQLAEFLGISKGDLPIEAWEPQRLLPLASEVITVPLSHDDVYTSHECLAPVLNFFQNGSFRRLEEHCAQG